MIKSLAQLDAEDPESRRKAYELGEQKIMLDVPSPDPYTPEPFEEFTESFYGHPGFRPEGLFIALDGDKYIGLSGLFTRVGQPGKYMTGLTGVLGSHRRRGIAKALKVYAIRYVQENQGHTIETDNEENNPMYDLNMQLGFKPEPAWVDYERPWDGAISN